MSALADRQNPWLGLLAYGESECEFFFGREAETAELMRLVEDEPLVVLYGISGLGKTSLLQAGLFKHLRATDFFPVAIRLSADWEHPYLLHWESGSLAGTPEWNFAGNEMPRVPLSCQIHFENLPRAASKVGVKVPPSDRGEVFLTLWEFFHRTDAQFWSGRQRLLTPVLIFDQFEEIFTLGQENEVRRERTAGFIQELSDLIYNRPPAAFQQRLERGSLNPADYVFEPVPLRIVLSLREDFLPQFSELRERWFPTLLKAALRIHPLSLKAAREVIELPGRDLLEPGVSEQIVRFVANAPATAPVVSSGGGGAPAVDPRSAISNSQWIEPALLSVVCRELNAERQRRGIARINADLLTLSQEQILADFYERSFIGIALGLRHFVEDELLTPGGFRDSRALDDALSHSGIVQTEIDQLIERRLLHYQDRQDGPRRIELTHDLLARVVRASRRRREEEQSQLETEEAARRAEEEARVAAERLAAAEVEREREAQAREAAERLQHQAEQARDLAERERRRARRLTALAAGVALLAAAAALFAYQQRSRARTAETAAIERARDVEAEKKKVEAEKQRAEAGEKAAQIASEKAIAAKESADEVIRKQVIELNSLGYATGQSVLLTHMAVGTLADAFVAKTYKSGEAANFITTYINITKGSKEQMGKLVDAGGLSDADAQFVRSTMAVLDLILEESRALETFVRSGANSDAAAYDKARKKALKEIKTLLGMKD